MVGDTLILAHQQCTRSMRLSSFNSSVPVSLLNRFACLRGSIELRGIRELSTVGLILGGDAGKRHNSTWANEAMSGRQAART